MLNIGAFEFFLNFKGLEFHDVFITFLQAAANGKASHPTNTLNYIKTSGIRVKNFDHAVEIVDQTTVIPKQSIIQIQYPYPPKQRQRIRYDREGNECLYWDCAQAPGAELGREATTVTLMVTETWCSLKISGSDFESVIRRARAARGEQVPNAYEASLKR